MRRSIIVLVMVFCLAAGESAFADLTDGLVAYYPFNGNVDAVYGPTGIVEGTTLTPDRFGNLDSAYAFDGYDDRILIGDVELVTGYVMSVQAWFKVDSFGGFSGQYDNPIVSKLFYGVDYYLGGNLYADKERVEFVVTGDGRAISDMPLSDGSWHQAVGVYDGTLPSDNVKLYIDGFLQSTTADNTFDIAQTSNSLAIGANVGTSGSYYPYDYFCGTIDL